MSSRRQPGKILLELVLLQLVHARAARHDHRLDVEVVERVRDAVEQHAVAGGDLGALVVRRPPTSADSRSTGSPAAAPSARRRDTASPASRGRPGRTGARSRSPENRTPRPSPRVIFCGSRMIGTIVSSSMSSSARDVRFGRPPGIGLLMKWITCGLHLALARRSAAACCVCLLREPIA